MANETLYTAEQYFGTFYDVYDEDYMLTKYAGQLHAEEEWESIMDAECNEHPEWANSDNL